MELLEKALFLTVDYLLQSSRKYQLSSRGNIILDFSENLFVNTLKVLIMSKLKVLSKRLIIQFRVCNTQL